MADPVIIPQTKHLVRFDRAQSLTDPQKVQVKANIGFSWVDLPGFLPLDQLPAHSHSDLVPYTGASGPVDLGVHSLEVADVVATNSVDSPSYLLNGDPLDTVLVPYNGATAAVDIGDNSFSAGPGTFDGNVGIVSAGGKLIFENQASINLYRNDTQLKCDTTFNPAAIYATGAISAGSIGNSFGAQYSHDATVTLAVTNLTASRVPFEIKTVVGQTADAFRLLNSAGTVRAAITSSGTLWVGASTNAEVSSTRVSWGAGGGGGGSIQNGAITCGPNSKFAFSSSNGIVAGDAAFSRISAGVVALGNGTLGNASGSLQLARADLGTLPVGPTYSPLNIMVNGSGSGITIAGSAGDFIQYVGGSLVKGLLGSGSVPLVVSSPTVALRSDNTIQFRNTANTAFAGLQAGLIEAGEIVVGSGTHAFLSAHAGNTSFDSFADFSVVAAHATNRWAVGIDNSLNRFAICKNPGGSGMPFGSADLLTLDGSGKLTLSAGLGVWGTPPPAVKPTLPTNPTNAEIASLLSTYGLCTLV